MDRTTVSQAVWLEVSHTESKINPADDSAFDAVLNRALTVASEHYGYQGVATLTTVASTDLYSKEALSPKILVPHTISDTDERIIPKRIAQQEPIRRSRSEGKPAEWGILGNQIVLFPIPDDAYDLNVTGWAIHPFVTTASPGIDIDGAYEQALVDYVVSLVRQYPDPLAQAQARHMALIGMARLKLAAMSAQFSSMAALPPAVYGMVRQ
jgi:hypothetical protein